MLDVLSRAERCRDLAEEYRRVAAMCPSTEMANHYRRMAERYSSLADAEELGRLAPADSTGLTRVRTGNRGDC
jgi:hypothetical protein